MKLTKTEFEQFLTDSGYFCEKDAQYPSVIVRDKKDVKRTYKEIKKICTDKGYTSSFAVRHYREGMSVYPEGFLMQDGTGSIVMEDIPLEDVSLDIGDGACESVSFDAVNGAEKAADFSEDVSHAGDSSGQDAISENTSSLDETGKGVPSQLSMFDMFSMFNSMGA